MKRKLILTVLCVFSIAYITPSKGQELSEQQIASVESQIDSVFKEMVILAEQLDYDGLSKGVDDRYKAGLFQMANITTLMPP